MTNKDLISQYVDTGIQLPEYQINKLSPNDKKSYIRKRIIFCIDTRSSILTDYEYDLITDENEKQRYDAFYEPIEKNYMSKYPSQLEGVYCALPDSFHHAYNLKISISDVSDFSKKQYECMSDYRRYWTLYRIFNWYGVIYSDYQRNEFIRLHDKFENEDPEFDSLNDDSNFIKLRSKK
jgi:hypothetical protein